MNQGGPYLGKLVDAVVRRLEPSVDDVDAVGGGVGHVLLHEAAETAQVGGDTGDSHHRALSCQSRKKTWF